MYILIKSQQIYWNYLFLILVLVPFQKHMESRLNLLNFILSLHDLSPFTKR
jgi:hypothetical protein